MREEVSGLQYLVTPSEVAEVVGVGRSTVSNWRDRYPTFPDPVPGGRNRQFDAEEVLDWVRSPASPAGAHVAPSPGWWWSKAVEAFDAAYPSAPTRAYLAALVLLNGVLTTGTGGVAPEPERWSSLLEATHPVAALAGEAGRLERTHRPLDGLLSEPLSSIEVGVPALRELVRRLDDLRSVDRPVVAFEAVLRGAEDSAAVRREVATQPEIAELMCRLAGVGPASTVLDPAAGEGTILLAAARESAGTRGAAQLVGQELDPTNWRIARSRFLVHGVSADLGEPGHDSIRADQWSDLRADAVLVDPPVTGTDPVLPLWVDHATRHLREGGLAIIALPAHAIVEVPSARRSTDPHLAARLDWLLRDGLVEGIVVTPRRVRSDVVGPMTLWVVRHDPSPQREVLVVAPLEKRTRVRTRSPDDWVPLPADTVAATFETWRDQGETTPRKLRPGVLVRPVPASRVYATLAEAVNDVSAPTARASGDERKRREQQREAYIKRLIDLVERNLETLWGKDRAEYMEVREQINAIRRLR